jgi:hypothetical protein
MDAQENDFTGTLLSASGLTHTWLVFRYKMENRL